MTISTAKPNTADHIPAETVRGAELRAGFLLGALVRPVGASLGDADGLSLGDSEGASLGDSDGLSLGASVGLSVITVGDDDGDDDGVDDGVDVLSETQIPPVV